MWICVAYFKVAPHDAENLPICALFRNGQQFHVVRAASNTELQQYDGTNTARFSRIVAARPKAVFSNTYISIGDITVEPTILEAEVVRLPPIDPDSPTGKKVP